MCDLINNPNHYCEGRKYQPIAVINDWGLNFQLGNAVKYISRAGRKDDAIQDLKKARFYLDYEIERLELEKTLEANKTITPEQIRRVLNEVKP